MRRAAAGLAGLTMLLLAGCGSPAKPVASRNGVQTGAGGLFAPGGSTGESGTAAGTGHDLVVRLGYLAADNDGVVLEGLQRGLFQEDIGGGVSLDPEPFSSDHMEAAAFHGIRSLDAAYVSPILAVRLWQSSRGQLIRIVSGEASATVAGSPASAAVLVVSVKFLAASPQAVSGLLKAQIQANYLFATDRTPAEEAAGVQLAAVSGRQVAERVLARSFARFSFTNDPFAASMLAEAQQAAAAGQLRPVKSLTGLFDLAPLNKLLQAAGQRPVR